MILGMKILVCIDASFISNLESSYISQVKKNGLKMLPLYIFYYCVARVLIYD